MQSEQHDLQAIEQKDIMQTFPLVKELFAFARERGMGGGSYGEYIDEGGGENPHATNLPERFKSLVGDFPGAYYLVAYDDRRSTYYKEGTRGQRVWLSTVRKRKQSDERMREIDFQESDPSLGQKMLMTVRELVNEKSYININTAKGEEVGQPHGHAYLTFELKPDGPKEMTEASYNRLDEGIFNWKGERKPVRWVRNLRMARPEGDAAELEYEDLYIIGRNQEDGEDKRAQVTVKIAGPLNRPERIDLEIGPPGLSPIGSKKRNAYINVITHAPLGGYQSGMEILREDPAYAALFKEPLDPEVLRQAVTGKIRMLQEDWDKRQTIFAEPPTLETTKKQITGSGNYALLKNIFPVSRFWEAVHFIRGKKGSVNRSKFSETLA